MKTEKLRSKQEGTKKRTSSLTRRHPKMLTLQEFRKRMMSKTSHAYISVGESRFAIPESKKKLITEILSDEPKRSEIQENNEDLSTQEVADLLNVSRPFVVKLIENHELRSFNVGSHRRVSRTDALEFRRKMRNEQNKALDELNEETENLGLDFT